MSVSELLECASAFCHETLKDAGRRVYSEMERQQGSGCGL